MKAKQLLQSASKQASRYLSDSKQVAKGADLLAAGGGLSAIVMLNAFTKLDNIQGSKLTLVDDNKFKTTPWHHEHSPVDLLQHQSFADYGEDFLDWTDNNRDEIIDFVEEKGGKRAEKWLEGNRGFLEQASRDELISDWTRRFPRAVVGMYLDEKKDESVQRAKEKGVDLQFVDGLVTDVEKVKDGYSVLVKSGANDPMSAALLLNAKELLVGTGIPDAPEKESLKQADDYYGNMYRDGNFYNLLDDINRKYDEKGGQKVNVNVTGFGPAGLDVAYWLYNEGLANPEFEDKYNLTVIGNMNKLRPGAYTSDKEEPFQPTFKEQYKSPEDVMGDIYKNEEFAMDMGYTQGEARTAMRNKLKEIMPSQPENVQDEFKGPKYMAKYLNNLSTEAHESHSSVGKLKEKGILKTVEGKVDADSLDERKEGGFEFEYYDKNGTYKSECDIYINCAHNLTEEIQKIKEETWLGKLANEKDIHITGFNASFKDDYEFQPMDVYAQAPSIAGVMKELARDLSYRAQERNQQSSGAGRAA